MTGDGDRETLARQAAYFRERTERLAARLVQADVTASSLRHELEQKRRGFSLLARMAPALTGSPGVVDTFEAAAAHINPTLNMQRTAILVPAEAGAYAAAILRGYERDEAAAVRAEQHPLPAPMLDAERPVLMNRVAEREPFQAVFDWLRLPFFVSMPVQLHGDIEAVLVTGRLREQMPFTPALGQGDAETVQAITAALAAMLGQRRLSEFEQLANQDPLTGVANLRGGRAGLERALAEAGAREGRVGLLFIDLDGFKPVNDRLGHDVGDALLRIVAGRLQGGVRRSDTVARVGGDEFMVVLADIRQPEKAEHVARKLHGIIRKPIAHGGHSLGIGLSIGVACHPHHGGDADTLLRRADAAMYAAKRAGGTWCLAAADDASQAQG